MYIYIYIYIYIIIIIIIIKATRFLTRHICEEYIVPLSNKRVDWQ